MNLENRLLKRKKLGNYRKLPHSKPLVDFASNDYLGLAQSSELETLLNEELQKYPHSKIGSTGSRLLTGNSEYTESLEKRVAAFHGTETATLFTCGYMANVGLISSVAKEESPLFFDHHIHASTRDGIRLSRARSFAFRHNDLNHLESRLKNSKKGAFVCIESIYSTDGSFAPLLEIVQLTKKYEAHLIVDEAHSVGICGKEGRGLISELGLSSQVFAVILTFGKALGTFGAAVLGNSLLKETLINFSTPFIYTTALPFQMVAAIKCSYDLFPTLEKERELLRRWISLFNGSGAIQSIRVENNDHARERVTQLASFGFDVRALLSPTVQRGEEKLRITLHSFNSENEIKGLKRCLDL